MYLLKQACFRQTTQNSSLEDGKQDLSQMIFERYVCCQKRKYKRKKEIERWKEDQKIWCIWKPWVFNGWACSPRKIGFGREMSILLPPETVIGHLVHHVWQSQQTHKEVGQEGQRHTQREASFEPLDAATRKLMPSVDRQELMPYLSSPPPKLSCVRCLSWATTELCPVEDTQELSLLFWLQSCETETGWTT